MFLKLPESKYNAQRTPRKYGKKCKSGDMYTNLRDSSGNLKKPKKNKNVNISSNIVTIVPTLLHNKRDAVEGKIKMLNCIPRHLTVIVLSAKNL